MEKKATKHFVGRPPPSRNGLRKSWIYLYLRVPYAPAESHPCISALKQSLNDGIGALYRPLILGMPPASAHGKLSEVLTEGQHRFVKPALRTAVGI
jgi:hypothetical protein